MREERLTFPSNGGIAHGHLTVPDSGRGPGVVVIQEWWGLTDHIKEVCARLTELGFIALAPDLFGGQIAHDAPEAAALMHALPPEKAAVDLGGAVDYLLGYEGVTSTGVGAIGFCMGGGFVLQLAKNDARVTAAVPFYGVGPAIPAQYHGMTAAVQGHYGLDDHVYPLENARALEQQLREESDGPVEFFYYPAGHAFHNDDDHMGTYDPVLAAEAWERSVAFLREHV